MLVMRGIAVLIGGTTNFPGDGSQPGTAGSMTGGYSGFARMCVCVCVCVCVCARVCTRVRHSVLVLCGR